jgi:hypothetical protein
VSSGYCGRYPGENKEFFHTCGLHGTWDVCRQIPLILGRPFLSTAGATIDVVAEIIKLNISGKDETFTFKHKGTEQCNQVMVTIRLERNAMTPDKKPSTAEDFSMNFSRRVKNATPAAISSLVAPAT